MRIIITLSFGLHYIALISTSLLCRNLLRRVNKSVKRVTWWHSISHQYKCEYLGM